MELNPDDKKVIDLLSKLKNTNGGYPSDILAARRQAYLKQVANVGLGIGVGAGIKNAAKNGNGVGAVATITSKILETTLIAAIAIEAGAVAYIYRDKIVDLIRTYTGSSNNAQESGSSNTGLIEPTVSPPATVTTPSATAATPSVTVTTPSSTVTVTAGTPSPNVAGNNNSSGVSVNATPKPGDNNGNHYGQTPKPERTKDNNNNNNDKNNDGGSGNTDNGKPQKP